MVFSHCSTFGPRMKCCESSTSAIAAFTSGFMSLYCALRSSNGTFILRFLFQFSIRFGAHAKLLRQRGFFVEIEATEDAGFDLLVAVACFWTSHHALSVRRIETVTVPAHPSHLTCRVSNHQREVAN